MTFGDLAALYRETEREVDDRAEEQNGTQKDTITTKHEETNCLPISFS